jgi:hypothetical protein
MTGRDLGDLRRRSGLGRLAFARALGFRGSDANVRRKVIRLEHERRLPETVALLVAALDMELEVRRLAALRAT